MALKEYQEIQPAYIRSIHGHYNTKGRPLISTGMTLKRDQLKITVKPLFDKFPLVFNPRTLICSTHRKELLLLLQPLNGGYSKIYRSKIPGSGHWRFLVVLVPGISLPSLSTHQHCPDVPPHCMFSNPPSSLHLGM